MSGTGKTVPQLSEVVPVRAPATYLPLCAHPSVADEAVVQPSALPHNSPVLQKAGTALQLRVLPGQPSWLSDLMPDGGGSAESALGLARNPRGQSASAKQCPPGCCHGHCLCPNSRKGPVL